LTLTHSNALFNVHFLSIGQNGGRRPIHRSSRWHKAAKAAGDNIIGETGQAEQRTHACSQNRKCQQD